MVNESAVGAGVDRLRLLASAIGGRALEVGVTGAGAPAWTDGTTIFVDARTGPTEQVRMVGVQAALLAAGSLDAVVVRQLARRPALARRYLAVEGHRALAASERFLPPVVRSLTDLDLGACVDTPGASLTLARGRRAIDDPPASFGAIRPRRLLASSEPGDAAAGLPEEAHGAPPGHVVALGEIDAGDDDGQSVGHLLSSPVGGRGALGRLLQRMLGASHEPGGGGPAGPSSPTRGGRARSRVTLASANAALPDVTAAFGPRRMTYPEWDVHERRYRPDWCTVHEHDPRPEDGAPLVMPDGRALRRPLARLGTGLDRTHRQLQGDDIDIDAAVEARVEALAGSPPDEAVYVDSVRRRRDLAVLLLLDISGSAGEPTAAGPTVHEHQRSAAAALTTALHDLGDRVALYAFYSQGRHAVHVTRVKAFDDQLDSQVARRLGGLVPGAYTRLGAAIRHGACVLEERSGTSRRLLLVLSDGLAYDHGYGSRYGEADARRALGEARGRGLACACLSVGAGRAPRALQRVFGPTVHAAMPTPDALAALIGPLLRAALRSARRTS